ncbi:MAG: DUF6894 family protein [Sphingomicrobium sp.]
MARYYFNIDDGAGIEDTVGMELSSLAEAKCEAVSYAGRLICDHAGRFWNSGDWNMTVTNENGLSLFSLQLVGTESPAIRPVTSPASA